MANSIQQVRGGIDLADVELRTRAARYPQSQATFGPEVALADGARPHSVAVAQDDATAYVTQWAAGGVAVVDIATASATSTITDIQNPYGVAMSGPRGLNVVRPEGDALFFVDLDAPDAAASSGINHKPYGIAERDGVVYLSLGLENAILVTDRFGKGSNEQIKGVEFPIGLAVDDHRLYVANYFASTVSVVDVAQMAVTSSFAVPSNPYGLALSPDGLRLYIAHFPDSLVSVIDTASGTVQTTAVVADGPRGVATSRDGTRLFVTKFFADTVAVIDVASLAVSGEGR